jgi:hypothetical protein
MSAIGSRTHQLTNQWDALRHRGRKCASGKTYTDCAESTPENDPTATLDGGRKELSQGDVTDVPNVARRPIDWLADGYGCGVDVLGRPHSINVDTAASVCVESRHFFRQNFFHQVT